MATRDQLPLSEATLLILISLANQARHGYGIMKDVEELSAGRVNLSTGTLYGALRRLLKRGWISRVPAEQAPEEPDGRNQKFYQLTRQGQRMLEAELERIKQLTAMVERRQLNYGV